ncbi:ankyrin repeat and SOCS box protein 16-like [Branchiostoma lanceolatum]|uniref:ankyrin repeat and SOCS box protein 16-like n=1 Tax=Branchiostoma lanceolatum TaxID=7740 RepID=UPI0034511F62
MGNSYSCGGVFPGDVVNGRRGPPPVEWPSVDGTYLVYRLILENDAEALGDLLLQYDINAELLVDVREVEKNIPLLVMSSDQLRGGGMLLPDQLELLRQFLRGDYSQLSKRITSLHDTKKDRVYIVGMSPLQVACMVGHLDCISVLLRMGADPEAKETRFSAVIWPEREQVGTVVHPLSPVQLCAANGHVDCLEKLLECIPPPEESFKTKVCGATVAHISRTPLLHLSAVLEQPDCLKMLVSRGVNLEERDETDMTETFGRGQVEDSVCLQEVLRYAYGGVDAGLGLLGMTALLHACKSANATCLEVLLEHGVDCSSPTRRQESPLHLLASHGVRYKNSHGVTDHSFENCLRMLLNRGALLNCTDDTRLDLIDKPVIKMFQEGLPGHCLLNCILMYLHASTFTLRRTKAVPSWVKPYHWHNLEAREVDGSPADSVLNLTARVAVEIPKDMLFMGMPDARERRMVPNCNGVYLKYVLSLPNEPRKLADLSRLTVRWALGRHVQRDIGKLNLPKALESFILLWDLDCD